MGRWMFSALPFAGSAAILLFSIRGSTIADDIFASAVRALHGDRDHQTFYFFQDFCFYSITAFSFCPLPDPGYYRVRGRKCYECKDCGNQIHPLANTIFHSPPRLYGIGSMLSFCFQSPRMA
jgi:hypothetical protein